jgi:hypothetical protein
MNRAERLYRIDALLKAKPHSLQQLQDALESSRATVVRDLSYLKDFMQAPIEYHRTDNVYRYAADAGRFELPGFWLNESELCALLATGQMLDQMQPGLLAPYIGPLRRRIRDLLAQSGHSARDVADSILLQPMATRTTHPERFGTIAGALLEGRALLIRYRARSRDEVTERVIHPQRLIRYGTTGTSPRIASGRKGFASSRSTGSTAPSTTRRLAPRSSARPLSASWAAASASSPAAPPPGRCCGSAPRPRAGSQTRSGTRTRSGSGRGRATSCKCPIRTRGSCCGTS